MKGNKKSTSKKGLLKPATAFKKGLKSLGMRAESQLKKDRKKKKLIFGY